MTDEFHGLSTAEITEDQMKFEGNYKW